MRNCINHDNPARNNVRSFVHTHSLIQYHSLIQSFNTLVVYQAFRKHQKTTIPTVPLYQPTLISLLPNSPRMASSNTLNIQTVLTPKSTQFTRPTGTKRNNDDDDDDGNQPPNPPKRPRQNKNPPIGSLAICDFCKNHPAGQAAHAINRCDWALHGASTLECKNCANYRFQNRGNGAADHQCKVGGGAIIAERIYSDFDPAAFPVQSCQACVRKGFPNSCDVDVLLNYACSTCTKGKSAHCRVNGRDMDPSPRVRLGDYKWYRHACDACIDGHYTTQTQCSWLTDRTVWDRRCNRCDANNQICLQSSNIVERPRAVDPPVSWEVPTTDTVP